MSAGEKAVPLVEENPDWEDQLPNYVCDCGSYGKGHDLLCEEEETTLWCPVCGTAGWQWGELV
jgi:hypothetical protein